MMECEGKREEKPAKAELQQLNGGGVGGDVRAQSPLTKHTLLRLYLCGVNFYKLMFAAVLPLSVPLQFYFYLTNALASLCSGSEHSEHLQEFKLV